MLNSGFVEGCVPWFLCVYSYTNQADISSSGFDTDTLGPVQFRGGESEALARLYRHLERKVSQPFSAATIRLLILWLLTF